ncbi:hypothetical protein [Brevibacterium siliguriense]|uniref:hypothetical protein n=1 Tax=Brevibacterium siliguriense TaxID=1136497 RepID=UPI001E43520A|nr:hypothetical protein [Brevibacterium siliguriense]
MKNPRIIGTIAVIILLGLTPLAYSQENYAMRVITVGMCAAIAVYGLNIILGFTGQLNLAQGGFSESAPTGWGCSPPITTGASGQHSSCPSSGQR